MPRRSRLLAFAVSALARAAGTLARLSGRAGCAVAALPLVINEMATIAARFFARIMGLPRFVRRSLRHSLAAGDEPAPGRRHNRLTRRPFPSFVRVPQGCPRRG